MWNPNPNFIAPSPPANDNSRRIATTNWVQGNTVTSIGGESGAISLGPLLGVSGGVLNVSPIATLFLIGDGITTYTVTPGDHMRLFHSFASSVVTTLTLIFPNTLPSGHITYYVVGAGSSGPNFITVESTGSGTIQSSIGTSNSQTLHGELQMTMGMYFAPTLQLMYPSS